jgi:hypothetical protein
VQVGKPATGIKHYRIFLALAMGELTIIFYNEPSGSIKCGEFSD